MASTNACPWTLDLLLLAETCLNVRSLLPFKNGTVTHGDEVRADGPHRNGVLRITIACTGVAAARFPLCLHVKSRHLGDAYRYPTDIDRIEMKFGLQTLVSLVTGSSLLCVIIREPQLAFFILTFGMGIPVLAIGLTAPQIGTRLHVESRPLAMPLMKTWAVVAVGVVLLGLLDLIFPSLRYDLGFPRTQSYNRWF
ncbi:hypothetical protein [Rubripirellula obstinata]|uniref:hypothetical protein n=1 Tax=Rubripirellula obstinata TaxID=406547 RepID=UPI0013589ED5|nr:hypothetical protein [Rubripirellula obstinata]